MDKIEIMRTFVTVATESSFSKAAERLDHSPQLVSKYVSALEEEVGVRLLNRTTRRLHLTEAGLYYLERARQLLEDFDEMQSAVGDYQANPRGRLRISAPVSFATAHMGQLISDFSARYPDVSIDIQLNDRKVNIVDEGFDIAIRVGQLKDSSLIARKLAPIRLVACASPEYLNKHGKPATVSELSAHKLLGYSYMDQTDSLWPAKTSHIESNNGDLLVKCAVEGRGIAVQPTFIAGEAIAAGKLEIILKDFEPAPLGLYAVYAHRTLLANKVRYFIDFMSDYFGDPPYWDRHLE
jgi:DNA-binding transcriptional LysR family regulator